MITAEEEVIMITAEEAEEVQEQPVSTFLSELGALGTPFALGVVANASAVQEAEEVDTDTEEAVAVCQVLQVVLLPMQDTMVGGGDPTTRKKKSE